MYKYKMIMKKILLCLVMLVTAATMNAQIELEHVFDGLFMIQYQTYNRIEGLHDMILIEGDDGKLYVYNLDYSLYGVFDAAHSVTRNIFTTDNKISFVRTVDEGEYPNYKSKVTIFNENNKIIQSFQFEGWVSTSAFPIKMGTHYKLVVMERLTNPERYKTYIYSCPGNGEATTSVENVPTKVKRNAYPNPASDLVTLPYEVDGATSMKIYDMQGKLVERKFLDESKQELQLDIKDYTSGMYFFEVNGESNSFIVK